MSAALRKLLDAKPDSLRARGLNRFAPYLMNRIIGRYNRTLRAELAQLGLTTPKMRALAVLSVRDGIMINELCVYAVAEQSTMSRTLDRMEETGLIERRPDARDSRARLIHLTDDGRALFDTLWPSLSAADARLFEGVGPEDQDRFLAILDRMLRNIRAHEI